MKSIFHIVATTPDDLRAELVTWALARAESDQQHSEHIARTKRDQAAHATSARVYREVAAFWKEVIIEAKIPAHALVIENKDYPRRLEAEAAKVVVQKAGA